MRMTTKLLSLLTILFVFFKFGESAKAMLSISGDKNFLFYTAALEADDVVGFVYDDANGGVILPTCATKEDTPLTLQENCTVTIAAVELSTAASGAEYRLTGLLGSTGTTNVMVAAVATPYVVAFTTTTIANSLTTKIAVTDSSTAGAAQTQSTFLCNNLDAATSETFFTVTTSTGDANVGLLTLSNLNTYPAVTKCLGDIQTTTTSVGLGTVVLIKTDHADITSRLYSIVFPTIFLPLTSINYNTTTGSEVAYIDGKGACPTSHANLTFPAGTSCKGKIVTKGEFEGGSYMNFTFGDKMYYLPVIGNNSATTTCSATTNSTADAFAFNFKYSKISIGMLLIYLLKMSSSY